MIPFRLPTGPELRKRWLAQIRRDNFNPNSLCGYAQTTLRPPALNGGHTQIFKDRGRANNFQRLPIVFTNDAQSGTKTARTATSDLAITSGSVTTEEDNMNDRDKVALDHSYHISFNPRKMKGYLQKSIDSAKGKNIIMKRKHDVHRSVSRRKWSLLARLSQTCARSQWFHTPLLVS